MKKKQVKHFVPNRPWVPENGPPACDQTWYALDDQGEVAKTQRQVTCKNCRRTRAFKKLK